MNRITTAVIFTLCLCITVATATFGQQPSKTSLAGAPGIKAASSAADTISSFTHACNGSINLTVALYSATQLKIISIHNNQVELSPAQASSLTGGSRDTSAKPGPPGGNAGPVAASKDTLYRYKVSFDAVNFISWIKNQYPEMDEACARYLAYKINQEWVLADTAYIRYRYGTAEVQQKDTVKDDKKKTKLHPVGAGTVTILPSSTTVLQPVYSNKKKLRVDTMQIQLQLTGPYNADANQVIFTSQDTSLKQSLRLSDAVVTISQNEWETALASKGVYTAILYAEVGNVQDSSDDTEYTYITIAGQSQSGTHKIQLDQRIYNPSKPFWVEVGTNFDFADGLQPNNFFGGIFLYERDIRPSRPFSLRKKEKRIQNPPSNFGLFAGVFESKSVTNTRDSGLLRSYYDGNSLALVDTNGNPGVFRDSGTVKTSQVVKNIGLFFSPQIRLTNGASNTDGLHVSAALWIELQWQRISSNIDYAGLKRRDTIHVPAGQLGPYAPAAAKPELDIRSHYYGLGLPIFYKKREANVFFNPTIGFTNQPESELISENFKNKFTKARRWLPYYMFQFRLNEEHFGIAFTGEVRGLLKKANPPFVSLALSKKFDLNKFLEFK